ncbi:hypothetical protein EVA_05438 [gut metagenome]|uniref:Uncharacterized protein n=1 Tax=gut metagenome TaxID=749906 RepID=J9GUH1_9ZZZZ
MRLHEAGFLKGFIHILVVQVIGSTVFTDIDTVTYGRISRRIFLISSQIFAPLAHGSVSGIVSFRETGSLVSSQVFVKGSLLWTVDRSLEAEIGIVVQVELFTFLGFLGGNQDYTGSCTCTVDGRRCCILQYGDAFNVFRVQQVYVTFDVVNQNQRIHTVDGYGTTYVEAFCFTR